MTKISFSALFKISLKDYKHFLIFGNDPGVFQRALLFLRQNIPYPLEEKTESDFLASSPYQNSLFTPSLPSFTLIPQASDKILSSLAHFNEHFLVFTSEKARAQSKIVSHFTTSPHCLAISSYATPLSLGELESLSQGISLSSDFKTQLLSLYQNDIEGLLSLFEKIKIFGDPSEEEYSFFLSPSPHRKEETPLQEAFLLKNIQKIVSLSSPTPMESIAFLRTLIRTFLILFEILSQKKILWEKLSFPLFFKERSLFESSLSLWNKKEVSLFLGTLLSLEKKVKSSSWSFTEIHHSLLTQIVSRETF